MMLMSETGKTPQGEVLEEQREDTDLPSLFKVLLHNDDYTTMEFVNHILEQIFHKSPAEAYRIMMHVHQRGIGIAGIYPHEVAETKVAQVHGEAHEAGHPLRASLEEE